MARRKVETGMAEPDMTPMIDIVFQLLTFFMIAINFENTKADERVKLPKDTLAKPPESKPKDELVLNIGFNRNAAGQKINPEAVLFYSGNEIALDRIKPELEQEKKFFEATHGKGALDDVGVIVRADAEVPTGLVQLVVKSCQEVGYSKFSLKAVQEE